MAAAPYLWARRVDTLFEKSLEVPMWKSPESFPLEELAATLREALHLPSLTLGLGHAEWKERDAIHSGLGDHPEELACTLSPIDSPLFFLMPKDDIKRLSGWMLNSNAKELQGLSDENLQSAFLKYVALETLECLDTTQAFPGVSPKFSDASLPEGESYCIDISIKNEDHTLWGRLVLPVPFQERWNAYYETLKPSISPQLASQVQVPLQIDGGSVKLSYEEWNEADVGDFIVLDRCTYHPITKKGVCQLTFNQQPLFQIKLKEDTVKILDFALYYEENKMVEEHPEETPEEEEPTEEETFEEDTEAEEEMSTPVETAEKEVVSFENLPIALTVELASLQMTLEKLKTLQPGNVIELAIKPEQGINLTINGKCVAKGELIQIGDVVGVKITEIGH